MELVEQILTIYENYAYETEVIVASIRHPRHVLDAALMGADIATVPFKVIAQLVQHPLTEKGIETFLKDWEKVPKK
jgi:transaldolase